MLDFAKNATKTTENNKFTAKLKLFGVVPAGDISVEVVDELYVYVVGETFGIKIYTEGVLVVGFSDVDAAEGSVNPAKEAGIKKFIVPYDNRNEAAIVPDIEIYPVKTLNEAVDFLNGEMEIEPYKTELDFSFEKIDDGLDFSDSKTYFCTGNSLDSRIFKLCAAYFALYCVYDTDKKYI